LRRRDDGGEEEGRPSGIDFMKLHFGRKSFRKSPPQT
jgi:hypothetical protein